MKYIQVYQKTRWQKVLWIFIKIICIVSITIFIFSDKLVDGRMGECIQDQRWRQKCRLWMDITFSQINCNSRLIDSSLQNASSLLKFSFLIQSHEKAQKQSLSMNQKSKSKYKTNKINSTKTIKDVQKIIPLKKYNWCLGWLDIIVQFTTKTIYIVLFSLLVLLFIGKERSLFIKLTFFLLIMVKVSCCVSGCNSSNCNITTGNCSACITGYYFTASTNGTCTNCSTVIANCNSCSIPIKCFSCLTGYYLNRPTNSTCNLCSSGISNCLSCLNQTYCSSCSTLYYLGNGNSICTICSSVISNCQTCTNQTYCSSCITQYYLSVGSISCIHCSSVIANCQTCANKTFCSVCITQYYFHIGTISCALCSSAITNCQTCTNHTFCSVCISQYYFDIGTLSCALCSLAISNCLTCTNTTKCSVCISTIYYVNSSAPGNMSCVLCSVGISKCASCVNQTYCLLCVSDSYYQRKTGITANCPLCSSAITNCSNCVNNTYCTSCLSTASYLLIAGSSSSCPLCSTALPNCTQCANQTYCNSCLSIAYLDNSSGIGANCIVCSLSMPNCKSCDDSITCVLCYPAYYLDGSGTCILCQLTLLNCTSCINTTVCTSCVTTNFYLLDNWSGNVDCILCSDNIDNCSMCTNSTYCTSCSLSYYIESNGIGTSSCLRCYSVITFCYLCINSTYCTTCNMISYLVNAGSGSTTCSLCSSAILYCYSCTNQTYCKECMSSYYPKITGVGQSICVLCWNGLPNCIICSNITFAGVSFLSCSSCAANYAPIFGNNTAFYCGVCSAVLSGCQYCLTPTSCYSCLSSYYYQIITHSCTLCSNVYPNCSNCSQSLCTKCYLGFYLSPNMSCSLCSPVLNGCADCDSSTNCLVCLSQYYNLNNLCYLCADTFSRCNSCSSTRCFSCEPSFYLNSLHKCDCIKGSLIGRYCIEVYGCSQTQEYDQTILCTGCAQQFTYNIQFLNCYCTHGNYISNVCTNLTGCISVMHTGGGQVCVMCNLTSYFILNNRSCICQFGFQLNQETSKACTEVCGDGLVFVLPCDDGNVRDNDGCSSTCQIEQYFTCYGGNSTNRSNCVYSGKQIKLQLTNIYKVPQSNTGVFLFKVTNIVSFIDFIDFGRYLKFDTLPLHTVSSVSYFRGTLTVKVDYTEDLEGRPANLTLDFQSFVFANAKPISVPFTMVSSTSPLVILDYPSQDTIALLSNMLLVTTIVSLIIFVVASQFHKMIGLQTLHTFQFAYLLPLVITDTSVVLGCFNNVSYSTGFGKQLFYNSQQAQLFGFSFVQFQAAKQFVENMSVNSTYLLVAIVLLVVAAVIAWMKDKNKRVRSMVFHLYHRIVFPVTISFVSILLVTVLLSNLQINEWLSQFKTVLTTSKYNIVPSQINTILMLFVTIVILAITTIQTIVSLSTHDTYSYQKNKEKQLIKILILNQDSIKARPYYIGFYILSILSIFSFTVILAFTQMFYSIFVLTSLITIYSFVIMVVRPYDNSFDNAHLILIQITELIICAGLSIKQYYLQSHQVLQPSLEVIWAWIVIGMLIFVNAMSIVRIIKLIKVKTQIIDQDLKKQYESLQRESNIGKDNNACVFDSPMPMKMKGRALKSKVSNQAQQEQVILGQYMMKAIKSTYLQNLLEK